MRVRRTLEQLAVAVALAGALLGGRSNCALADDATEQAAALDLGTKVYVYGVPLLNMDKTFRTQTSVNVSDGRGNGPVNQFSHARHLANPEDHTVVAPNHDTLYSIAWLDLKKQPIVLHVPDVPDRFYIMELLSPYEENFANVGTPTTGNLAGDYAITGPRWKGKLKPGLTEIKSPYDRVWVLGRTLIRGTEDEPAVQALQDQYTLTPLKKWGKAYTPKAPKKPDTEVNQATIPGTQSGDDPIAFFDALGVALKQFPPPAADQPLLDQLKTVGVGPKLRPSKNKKLSAATLQGLRDAVAAGKAAVNQALAQMLGSSLPTHNGYLVGATGTYGTDYASRAVVDQIGLGAALPTVALYPFAITDRNLAPLSGANRYVAHLPASMVPPPVYGFWSFTMYDSNMFFVPNAIERYVLNDRSDLHYNADGSLDFYFQTTAPTNPDQLKNWLPTPSGAFRVMFRLWGPDADAIPGILDGTGWQAPTIQPCDASGRTAAGWGCAR